MKNLYICFYFHSINFYDFDGGIVIAYGSDGSVYLELFYQELLKLEWSYMRSGTVPTHQIGMGNLVYYVSKSGKVIHDVSRSLTLLDILAALINAYELARSRVDSSLEFNGFVDQIFHSLGVNVSNDEILIDKFRRMINNLVERGLLFKYVLDDASIRGITYVVNFIKNRSSVFELTGSKFVEDNDTLEYLLNQYYQYKEIEKKAKSMHR
ncbi:MAG: hypothetical protein ACP6IP_10945 [Candidatus Njordarchaeia archaeon]